MQVQDPPTPDGTDSPTAGDPVGGHRVLEPPGGLPSVAARLDPGPDLWDREARLALTDVVLGRDDHAAVQRRAMGEPGRMRAALLEATAERGGLPPDLVGTALVGRIGARGPEAPPGPGIGDRAVVLPPAAAVPLWLQDVSAWSGGARIPVAGHAIVAARNSLVPVPDGVEAEVAVALAHAAHVPEAVRAAVTSRGTRVLVTGPTTVAGAVATLVAAAAGARVAGVVTGLAAARRVRGLGAATPVIVASGEPREGVRAVLESLGGAPDVVLVAEPDRDLLRIAAAAVSTSGTVRVLVPGADLDGAVLDASGVGSSPSVGLARRLPGGSDELFRLWDGNATYRALVRWRAGIAPAPEGAAITGDDGEPEGT